MFTLTSKVTDAFDFKVYVHVSHEAQKERFYRRAEERNLGSSVDEVYENALAKAKIHIRIFASLPKQLLCIKMYKKNRQKRWNDW